MVLSTILLYQLPACLLILGNAPIPSFGFYTAISQRKFLVFSCSLPRAWQLQLRSPSSFLPILEYSQHFHFEYNKRARWWYIGFDNVVAAVVGLDVYGKAVQYAWDLRNYGVYLSLVNLFIHYLFYNRTTESWCFNLLSVCI